MREVEELRAALAIKVCLDIYKYIHIFVCVCVYIYVGGWICGDCTFDRSVGVKCIGMLTYI